MIFSSDFLKYPNFVEWRKRDHLCFKNVSNSRIMQNKENKTAKKPFKINYAPARFNKAKIVKPKRD